MKLSEVSTRHPWSVLLAGLAVVAVMVPGLWRLTIHTDGAALVPQDSAPVQLDRDLRVAFGLNDQAVVLVDTGTPGGIYTSEALRVVQEVSLRIQELQAVGPLNVSSLATELSDRFQPGTLRFYTLLQPFPETPLEYQRVRDDVEANGLYVGNLVSRDASAAAILFGTPVENRVELSHAIWRIVEDIDAPNMTLRTIGAPFAEALLGNHILEDLGIPVAVLGRTPASDADPQALSGAFAFRTWIGENIGLLPIAIVIMALVFWIGFGSAVAMLLPLLQVGTCLAFTFGLMGYAGVPIYLTTAVLPIILTCIGIADEVHILGRYLQIVRRQAPRSQTRPQSGKAAGRPCVRQTMQEMIQPVVRTSITTSIGFLSFALAPIEPVRMFGIFATVGILFCMTWSLLATPALLALIPTRWLAQSPSLVAGPRAAAGDAGAGSATPPSRWIKLSLRFPGAVLVVALVLALVAGAGIRRLQVQDSWIDGFDPQSAFHRATQVFNQGFFGPHILQVAIDTGHETWNGVVNAADVHDNVYRLPVTLARNAVELQGAILRVQNVDTTRVATWDRVGNSSRTWTAILDSAVVHGDSVAFHAPRRAGSAEFLLRLQGDEDLRVEVETRRFDHFDTLERLRRLGEFIRAQERYAVGGVMGPADYIATTFFILHARDPDKRIIPAESKQIAAQWMHFGRVRGDHHVHRVISDDHSRGVLSVYLKNANYQDTQALLREIRAYEALHLTPFGIRLSFGGDVAVSQTLIGAIVETQVRSLLFSLLGILLISIVLSRSWRLGALTVFPCSFAILLNFGFMGWSGMPLGVATSMFAGMILGIGVDSAIHLLDRYKRAMAEGRTSTQAIVEAVSIAGKPILLDGAAVALGFGVLMISRVPANARLGTLAVLAVISCVLATLILLPSLLQTRRSPH